MSKSASANPYFIQNVGPITNSGFISDLGLNDSGEMVGTNNEMAWSWTASGKLVQLNPLLAAAAPTASWAWKINDAGQICGTYLDATGQNDFAYIYSASSGRDQPGHLHRSAGLHRRAGHGLSHQRVGAGGSGLYGNQWVDAGRCGQRRQQQRDGVQSLAQSAVIRTASITRAIRRGSAATTTGGTALLAARLEPGQLASGRVNVQGMSGNGQIVGNCYNGGTAPHAMLWKSGTATPTDLGTLGNSASTSLAYGVDDANGQVVGWSYLSGGTTFTAFVWSSGTGMVNLNTSGLVTNLATSGFSYLNAGVCVNDSGQIAGFGTTRRKAAAAQGESTRHSC